MSMLLIPELTSTMSISRAAHTGARPSPPMTLMRTEMGTAHIVLELLLARNTELQRKPMSTP